MNGPCEGTSSCGAETPQDKSKNPGSPIPLSVIPDLIRNPVSFACTNEPRAKDKSTTLDPRSESGMTEGWIPDRGLSLTFLIEDRG